MKGFHGHEEYPGSLRRPARGRSLRAMKSFLAGAIAMSMPLAAALAEGTADVHCHFTTPDYLALLEKHGALMDELYPIPAWSPEALGSFLDDAGIGLAVLTSVAPQPHFGDAAESAEACRRTAESFAAREPAGFRRTGGLYYRELL